MTNTGHFRPAARGTSVGLLLMGIFTSMWAAWAYSAAGGWFLILAVGFWAASALFVLHAIHLLRHIRHFPSPTETETQSGRTTQRRFGIIFNAEGIVIGATCAVLLIAHRFQFMAPAIALIVGLHFIPLSRVFHRRIDVWLGLFTALLGAVGIVSVGIDRDTYLIVWGVVGFLTAGVTAFYGVTMTQAKTALLRTVGDAHPLAGN